MSCIDHPEYRMKRLKYSEAVIDGTKPLSLSARRDSSRSRDASDDGQVEPPAFA